MVKRLIRYQEVALARARAGWFGRRAGLGRRVRFGPGVRCHIGPDANLVIGDDVEIGANTSLTVSRGGELLIGRNVFISGLCTIAAERHVAIGADSMLAEMVSIRDHDHDPSRPPRSGHTLQADVDIGERVWIGAKASVVRGGSIGDDTVIGAHALVNRPLPSDCLAAGVPAEIKRNQVRSGQRTAAVDGVARPAGAIPR